MLRELKIPLIATSNDPNTWREVLALLDEVFGPTLGTMRVALQEYGASNPELISALSDHCLSMTKVSVYQWALTLDLQPLRE